MSMPVGIFDDPSFIPPTGCAPREDSEMLSVLQNIALEHCIYPLKCAKMTKWILHLSNKSFQNTSNRIFRIQRWLLACSFATGNIACQISSAFSSPQCNDKIFRRKRCILSGIGPLFVLVKVHRTNDFSHNSSHFNYFLCSLTVVFIKIFILYYFQEEETCSN